MSQSFPVVEVSVVLITDTDGRFLLDFNGHWGGFTPPMSKRHELPAKARGDTSTLESPHAAGIRAAVEVLGRPLAPSALIALDVNVPPWNQSGRDGQWKRYQYHLFGLETNIVPQPLPGHAAVWLTRTELETLEPISATMRAILNVL